MNFVATVWSRPWVTVALLASMLWSGAACARPSAEEIAVAQQLYKEARRNQELRQWASCETSLKRAISILETPGLRFHLAFCKEQQHRWVEALVDYRRAEELIEGGVEAEDVKALLPHAITTLEQRTPQLTLVVEHPPEGTELYLDGKRVSTELLGTRIPVDPGLRRVEVAAPGYVPFTQAINLLASDRRELRVELVPRRSSPTPRQEEERAARGASEQQAGAPPAGGSAGTGKKLVLISEAALTMTALGVGVGFSFEASSREQDRNDLLREIRDSSACSGQAGEDALCAEVRAADDDARSARRIALGAYIGASVGAVALVATWLAWPDLEPPDAHRGGPQLAWMPGGVRFGYSGTF